MEQELQNPAEPDVIVVDDLEVNQVILIQMIESMGYQAAGVCSGREALELVREHLPKLFLLDITMPEMSGFELCQILKSDVRTRDIPVIFISATTDLDDKVMGFSLGGADFITKPFALAEVTARVSMQLHSYEMKREIEVYNKRLNRVINEQVKKIEEEQKNVLSAIAGVMAGSRCSAKSHMKNIKINARLLAQSLQFSPKFEEQVSNSFIEAIEIAAPLHDIGKLAISTQILEMNGRLSPEQEELVRTHAETGAQMLSGIGAGQGENRFIKMAAEIARYHHERWDGSGYPAGLKGDEIPLSARIVKILNNYEKLTGRGSLSGGCGFDESLAIMEKDVGIKYDPDIFGIFKRVRKQLVFDT